MFSVFNNQGTPANFTSVFGLLVATVNGPDVTTDVMKKDVTTDELTLLEVNFQKIFFIVGLYHMNYVL